MKYLFSLVIAVTLMGAGCTQATNIETQTSTNTDTQAQVQEQAAVNTQENSEQAPSEEPSDENSVEAEANIEVTTDTGTLTVTENTTVETEENVPVTEITLGMDSDTSMTMEAGNYFFTPDIITVAPGSTVKVSFAKNAGFHTFVIDAINLNFSINEGESVLFTAPSEPGSYTFYCDVGSHQSFGMEGTLIVK